MNKNNIIIASDHAGYKLKQELIQKLHEKNYEAVDLGTNNEESTDYPKYAHKMARFIQKNPDSFGILTCGSGIGMSIAANRHQGVRAALCTSPEMASLARQHNNANILVLSGRLMDTKTAWECVEKFLSTAFEGGRHERRVQEIDNPDAD